MNSRRSADLDQALFHAAKQQKLGLVTSLINKGANPNNYVGEDDFRSLHWAVKNEDFEMVAVLLKAGADVTLKCKYEGRSRTPMGLAVHLNTYLSWLNVKVIAKHRNDDQTKHSGHPLALINAIHLNHRETFRLLLEAGTRVDFKCGKYVLDSRFKSWTLLHFAVDRNDPDMIEALLKFSVDPNETDDKGQTPAQMAANLGNWNCFDVIQNYDSQMTGKAIFEKLKTTKCDPKEIEKLAPYKEAVFAYMLHLKDKMQRVGALETALDKAYGLGFFFWCKRGVAYPTLENGMLKRIVDQLEIEKKVNVEEKSSSAKVLTAIADKVVSTLSRPITLPIPSAPPTETRLYPDLSASAPLEPVYRPTWTNQLRDLPKVADLPKLPAVMRKEKKVAQPGF